MKRPLKEDSFQDSQPKRNRLEDTVRTSNMEIYGHGHVQEDCKSYLKDMRKRLGVEQYKEFLKIMEYVKEKKGEFSYVTETTDKIRKLLKGNEDLISGFNNFLPKEFRISVAPENDVEKNPDINNALSYLQKIKAHFHSNLDVYESILKIVKAFKRGSVSISKVYEQVAGLFRDDFELLQEFHVFLPLNSAAHHTDTDSENCKHDGTMNFDDVPAHPVKVNVKMTNFANQDRKGSKTAYRRRVTPSSRHDKSDLRETYPPEFRFCDNVEKTLRDPVQYEEFLKCLLTYSSKTISRQLLKDQARCCISNRALIIGDRQSIFASVQVILGKFPGLMDELDEFLALCGEKGKLPKDVHNHECAQIEGGYRECTGNRDETSSDHEGRKRGSHPTTDRGVPHRTKDITNRPYLNSEEEKLKGKSIQDLDLSKSESCTPSYRLLAKNYPRTGVSHRTKLGAELLNDDWVAVTSGEERNFKHACKNRYEESLFKIEDDRYELDMLLEIAKATIKHAEDLLDKINRNEVETNMGISVEEHFTAPQIRCIERLYDEWCLEMIDAISKNPIYYLPIIINRLKQKQEEWTTLRAVCNKDWGKAQAKVYHKSLDHSSFCSKEQDTEESVRLEDMFKNL
ncbi:Paired amphipathic helix protein Sin3-like 3-like protein [Drosera capensis]